MEQLERRQAKLRFKMNILDQLEEKRKKYEEMRQREDLFKAEEQERTYKSQVVEEARRRLLMERGGVALKGFLPKGVIQKARGHGRVRDEKRFGSLTRRCTRVNERLRRSS